MREPHAPACPIGFDLPEAQEVGLVGGGERRHSFILQTKSQESLRKIICTVEKGIRFPYNGEGTNQKNP